MILAHWLKPLYHKLHLGKPLGINLRKVIEDSDYLIALLIKPLRRFDHQNTKLSYAICRYNNTWLNERTIEIPIAKHLLKNSNKKDILEVGNVLQNYGFSKHTIVDKYEAGNQVINQDILDYKPKRTFKRIVTISTLEHIGQDEIPKDPKKVFQAIKHLQSLLSKDGEFYATIPNGYHQKLSQWVIDYHQKNPSLVTFYEKVDHPFNKWIPSNQSNGFTIPSQVITKIAIIRINKYTSIN
jgi:hypothetical protein